MNTDLLTAVWPILSALALFGVLLWTQTHWPRLETAMLYAVVALILLGLGYQGFALYYKVMS